MNTLHLAAVAAALSLATPAAAITINYDMGGNVASYIMKFSSARKPIRIMGHCASACTIALRYPSTCVGPRARLTFHSVSGAGRYTANFNRMLMSAYPPAVKSWIRARGGLTSRMITLSGAELRKRVRSCT